MIPADRDDSGRYAYEGLERIFHEKARLGILTCLVSHHDGLLFSELRDLCGLTDGNLNRHLAALEEAGLVVIAKQHSGKRSQTLLRMTEIGRQRFAGYLRHLESVIADALQAMQHPNEPGYQLS